MLVRKHATVDTKTYQELKSAIAVGRRRWGRVVWIKKVVYPKTDQHRPRFNNLNCSNLMVAQSKMAEFARFTLT